MLTSLALIFLAGLAMAALCSLLRLPRIIGMLFTGILLGPYVLGLLDPSSSPSAPTCAMPSMRCATWTLWTPKTATQR